MEKITKILIADDDRCFAEAMRDYFESYDNYHVCSLPENGYKTLEGITQHQPDVVILDLVMPGLDGIGVLEELKLHPLPRMPLLIFITALTQTALPRKAMELGADYYMMKPFELDVLEKRIRQLSETADPVATVLPHGNALEIETTRILHQMGVPAHVKGYHYLRDAIMLATESPTLMDAVTKELYPMIGDRHDTTASRVERAIRHAIELAWDRGNVDMMNKYFSYTIDIQRGKPTNSEFIAMISDKLRVGERMG